LKPKFTVVLSRATKYFLNALLRNNKTQFKDYMLFFGLNRLNVNLK